VTLADVAENLIRIATGKQLRRVTIFERRRRTGVTDSDASSRVACTCPVWPSMSCAATRRSRRATPMAEIVCENQKRREVVLSGRWKGSATPESTRRRRLSSPATEPAAAERAADPLDCVPLKRSSARLRPAPRSVTQNATPCHRERSFAVRLVRIFNNLAWSRSCLFLRRPTEVCHERQT
jgi:hypothetical protein